MGHAHVSTTATNYWVPTTLELNEQMNNPFTGQFQKKAQEVTETKKELELVYGKLDASMNLFSHLYGIAKASAAQGGSSAETLQRFHEAVPDLNAIVEGILDSTSSSLSGSAPRNQQANQEIPGNACLVDAIEEQEVVENNNSDEFLATDFSSNESESDTYEIESNAQKRPRY